ncbi:ATP-binding protein [Dactylosporangium sp. AC04546]|uniref:ATP-binding protein n=1 Tax=Dactylosporangium sp. AC04546 TaxID=2862460 RepID=UPI001EDD0BE2|nr:ATP-binding protein [Dactylosporangium sp. AC04546]WVK85072.1 ATP-binding protein [Dactylosporangium sp. AC04546]
MTGRLGRAVRQAGAGGILAIGLVVALGLAASWHAAQTIHDGRRDQAQAVLDRDASLSEIAVRTEIHRYLDTLRTIASAVGSHETLTTGDFDATTLPLREAGLAGATSLVFTVPASDGQVADVQRYWRERGATDLRLVPQGTGREHQFTIFSRSLDGGAGVPPGTDLSPLAEPTAALNEARRAGAPAVSDTYVLLRDRGLPAADQQLSFVLAAPVYGVPGADGERVFKGWVVMGLHGQDFVGGVLTAAVQGQVEARLWADNGGGRATLVARLDRPGRLDLRREITIPIANREWRLVVSADSAELGGTSPALPWLIGAGGTGLTVLVGAMLWALAGGRRRAEARVVAATAELREAERTARRQVALLNGILERISDGVGVVDEDGAFLVHNPAAQAMLGMAADVAGPDHWQEHYGIYRPDGVTPFPPSELPLVLALDGRSTDRVEMVIRNPGRPDGVWLSVSGRPLEVDGRRGAIAVFHDVTAAREREADLTAFAGIVAHDLKNPLTVIAAHAEMARDALSALPPHPGEAIDSIERVSNGVVRMRRLIDDLLAYTTARDAALKPRPLDLVELVTDVVGQRVNHLRVRPDVYVGPLPRVEADPAMLRHVLDNLVGNALKYVQPGRVPKIDISAGPAGPGWIRVEVADRGIGIPDADKPHVFESFHRAHTGQSYGGTGLGLAICRRIVDRHGGTITVADNPGGGSRFSFTVPAASSLPPTLAIEESELATLR